MKAAKMKTSKNQVSSETARLEQMSSPQLITLVTKLRKQNALLVETVEDLESEIEELKEEIEGLKGENEDLLEDAQENYERHVLKLPAACRSERRD